MTYSIREGVDDAKARLTALEAVLAKHPYAYLDTLADGRRAWVAESVVPTDFELVPDERSGGHLVPYEVVEGMRVYAQYGHHVHMSTFLSQTLKKEHPETYAALVSAVLKSRC